MALYKRAKTWHTDFSVNGQRFRQSLDTSDWRQAQAKEKELIAQASEGKLTPSRHDFSRLGFSQAADKYLDSRRLELSASSMKKERQLLVQPRHFFSAAPLANIARENLLLPYREQRSKSVGPAIVNMEIGVIRRILKKAKLWHLIAGDIRPLRERHQIGRALLEEQKLRLLRVAGSRPEWQGAYCAAVLALNTTMRGCELKGLRWSDIDLLDLTVTVRRSKTDAGERVIPLNANAMSAVLELYQRAKRFGTSEPMNYVFPACENGRIDAGRPQTSWRTAWRNLTRAIECPACGQLQNPGIICLNPECKGDIDGVRSSTAGLRFHDLRHHAITELAESQASDQTVMAIWGHVSPKMLAHYSHVRLQAKRNALEALSNRKPNVAILGSKEAGYVTKNVTRVGFEGATTAEVLERNGRHDWTRTSDLYRVNFEVNNLKPFPHLAFPHFLALENTPKQPSFDGELMASLPRHGATDSSRSIVGGMAIFANNHFRAIVRIEKKAHEARH